MSTIPVCIWGFSCDPRMHTEIKQIPVCIRGLLLNSVCKRGLTVVLKAATRGEGDTGEGGRGHEGEASEGGRGLAGEGMVCSGGKGTIAAAAIYRRRIRR